MHQEIFMLTRKEEVKAYFIEHGCELLEEYKGAIIPMEYRCKCGNISKISWNNFTKGKRCGWCKGHRVFKYTLEEVKNIFHNHGCKLLATEYKGNLERLDCICKCGRPWKVSVNSILSMKSHCKECGKEKLRIAFTKPGSKEYRKIYYKYRKSIRRTLAALNMKKLNYSHKLLGYTARELQEHLQKHPNWERVKDGEWHLDHIFPVKAFVEAGIKDVKLINCLDNLQPLSQRENNQKCDDYDKEAFSLWLQSH